jgi:NAD(P)H-dependent FMN reductase
MLTIVSASNRKENQTSIFAKACEAILMEKEIDVNYFSLDEIPVETSLTDVYKYGESSFTKISERIIQPADKFIFVIPEYNGSFPGILKLFIDGILPKDFNGKKACMIGISSGFAGNIRGMDHFCDVLNYIDVNVMPKKLSISRIDTFLDNGALTDEATKESIEVYLNKFLNF